MAFKLRASTYAVQSRRGLLDNSLTVKVGDVIIPLASNPSILTNASAAVAGDKYPLGVVVGFSGKNGEVIGDGADPANTPHQLVTAADNTTVAKYHAVYIPIVHEQEWLADIDAVPGTTTGSDKPFTWFNLVDARQLKEDSVLLTEHINAPLQVLSLGVSNESSSKLVVKFAKALRLRP